MKFLGFIAFLTFVFGCQNANHKVNNKAKKEKVEISKDAKPPLNFAQLISKIDGRSINYLTPFEMKKEGAFYTYSFFPYNGDGFEERSGKFDQNGQIRERKIDYKYCSHSMGSENTCYTAQLKELFDDSGEVKSLIGVYKEVRKRDKKILKNITVKDSDSLKRAKEADGVSALKPLVPNKIKKGLLGPLYINESK